MRVDLSKEQIKAIIRGLWSELNNVEKQMDNGNFGDFINDILKEGNVISYATALYLEKMIKESK